MIPGGQPGADPEEDYRMVNRKSRKWAAIVFVATAALFLALTYFSNKVLAVYDVTSVRPSAAMNPILGIAFGWPAILGCAVGNFLSDLLSGYGTAVALLGFLPQVIYGALPFYVWRRFVGCESHITRLDSPRVTLSFAVLMAVNAVVNGVAVGAIQYYVSGNNFFNSAVFVFLNDFDMCLIFGLPMMALIDWIYSRYLHHGKRRMSVNEKVIIVSAGVQFVVSVMIAIGVLVSRRNGRVDTVWKDIFMYCGYAVNAILVISAAVMVLIRHLKKQNEGLRIFERPNGTIYADEKRRLEFVSYPGKALEYRVKSDALNYSYENTRKHIHPSYENAWLVRLSTQKGCPMKCAFCDCPAYGFYGNASAEDLAYQIDTIVSNSGSSHTKRFEADFTRMGEPTLNPAVKAFIESGLREHIASKVDADVIYPTLSTMMPRDKEVAEYLRDYCRIKNEAYDGNAALQISIHTTDEAKRRKMFRDLSLSLKEIAEIAATLPSPKGSKYMLNFAVIKDSVIDAAVIDRLFDKEKFLIRMTPVHQTFNAIDNGFNVTTEYSSFDTFEQFEKAFLALGWDVVTCLDSPEEDLNELTCGNLLLSNITEKITPTPSGKKRIGLIVAIEMEAIFKHYHEWKELAAPPGFKLFLVERDTYDIYILRTGMGEISASTGVQYLVAKYDVNTIVNFGVVGGLTEDMKTQKLCLVERVVHYKYDCSEFMDLAVGQVDGHDSIYLRPSESLMKSALSIMGDLSPVTCCSGDKFISTTREKQYLHETFGGDICDMESAGIVLACEANGVPCLLMKAVSDGLADGAAGFYAELQNTSLQCLVATDTILERLALIES